MGELVLAGRWASALSHLALFGLAGIVASQSGGVVRVHWARTLRPVPTLTSELSTKELAEAVRAHARERVDGSWVNATFNHLGRPTGVFSPRITPASSVVAWQALQTERHRGLDSLPDQGVGDRQRLDRSLIAALGEPGYWIAYKAGEARPDGAASRWEMKTRNRGDEFVQDRLLKLAAAVARRPLEQIAAGLEGSSLVDETHKQQKGESRTPTGLAAPQPTDTALAWCALWGIAFFPTRPIAGALAVRSGQTGAPSISAGADVRRAGIWLYLPIPYRPVTLPVLRSVIASRALARAATPQTDSDSGDHQWLQRKGVGGILRCRMNVSGNKSAPERWLSDGERISFLNPVQSSVTG